MQMPSSLDQDGVIGDLLRKSVFEDVLDIADGRLLVNELTKFETGDKPIKFFVRSSGDRAGKASHELAAEYSKGLQEILFVVVKPVNASREDGLHRRRDLESGKWLEELHLPIAFLERALVKK